MNEKTREDWQEWFDHLTDEHEGDGIRIEVAGPDMGDAVEADAVPLSYIEYDRKDDVVIVAVGDHDGSRPVSLRHLVHHPEAVSYEPARGRGDWFIDIRAADGSRTRVAAAPRP
jgi:hypothetical protein